MPIPNIVPLKPSFMVASLLGLIISIFYIYDISRSWAFAFAVLFAMMLIASIISMTYAPLKEKASKDPSKRM